jgi:hypothetical protein
MAVSFSRVMVTSFSVVTRGRVFSFWISLLSALKTALNTLKPGSGVNLGNCCQERPEFEFAA